MIARDRDQLADFLQSRLTGEYATGAARQPSGGNAIPVKTYLVESDRVINNTDSDDETSSEPALRKLLAEPILQLRYPARIHPSGDRRIFTIEGPYRGRTPVFLYADCTDPRFWLIHTLARSETADWIIGRLTGAGTGLARVVLPGQLLERLAELGSLQGLITAHDRRMLTHDGTGPGGTDFMSMQMWGAQSRRVLSLLRSDSSLSECLSLSRVHVRYSPDEENREAFCVDDIHCDGRLEARGTSFAAHLRLVDILRHSYQQHIETIESRYRVHTDDEPDTDHEPGTLLGGCLAIRPSRPFGDAADLCRRILCTSPPFRYWGVPAFSSPAFTRVSVMDLNLGSLFGLELTSEFIRVFLPAGASGSTVIRFFTNLQRHFDSRVRLLGQDEQDVFEFQA